MSEHSQSAQDEQQLEAPKTFKDMGLHPLTVKAVKQKGYEVPTDIQAQSISVILAGKDLVACAQTGTGKTAGYTLPILERLLKGRSRSMMPRGLVLAPTREIALQVQDNFVQYSKYHHFNATLLIGGMSPVEQERLLAKGPDVLIATPGRLLEHIEKGKILLQAVETVVIDEADRMLDMGFIPDVETIIRQLPPMRQTLMFSATMPDAIRRLSERFLHLPEEITITPTAMTAANIQQYAVPTPAGWREKQTALKRLLEQEGIEKAIIFSNRKIEVDKLAAFLNKLGKKAAAIHGDLTQQQRLNTLDQFKADELHFLVASDVAARGVHVNDLPAVINYDVPNHVDDYVHRIGRTGRAGKLGKAYTLVNPEHEEQWGEVLKYTKATVEELTVGGSGSGKPAGRSGDDADDKPARKRPPRKRREEAGDTPIKEAGKAASKESRPSRGRPNSKPRQDTDPHNDPVVKFDPNADSDDLNALPGFLS